MKGPLCPCFCDKFIDAKFIQRLFWRDYIYSKEKITKHSLHPELVNIADTVHYALSPPRSATWEDTYSHSPKKNIKKAMCPSMHMQFYADFFRALSFGDAKHETQPYRIGLRHGYEGKLKKIVDVVSRIVRLPYPVRYI